MISLIKQSTGAILLLFFWFSCLLDIFHNKESKNKRIIEILLSISPCLLFIVYLLLTNTFKDFWEYAICGIITFTHRIYIWEYVSSSPIAFIVVAFIIITIVWSIFTIIKSRTSEKSSVHIKVLTISYAAGTVGYPLTDHFHMMIALIPYIICFLFCIKKRHYSFRQHCFCYFIVVIILVVSSVGALFEVANFQRSEINYYEGIPIDGNVEAKIKLIDEYILSQEKNGIKVIIADVCAVACMIPLDKYNKNFDMLLIGNLGFNRIEDLLANGENTIYLITKDESTLGYQEHLELIKYIKQNYIKVGEVAGLNAYEKGN